MKGNLSQFEAKVNNVINKTYKIYKNDVAKAIGHLQTPKKTKEVLIEKTNEDLEETR